MKKIICAVMALLLLSSMGVAAEVNSVEISFRVGDSELIINGNKVSVETPYITGEGTTLVPVRVITEAFGAAIDWIADTKTVSISYPDVVVVMQIGNRNVTVNTHSETLAEPPALSANGVTMVPLRFISEAFGAEVKYNSATRDITVVKGAINQGSTVSGVTELDYVGDSFYGWSMPTPRAMVMIDRSFDGSYTCFETEGSWVEVYVTDVLETDDFASLYQNIKDSYSSMTLTAADKKTDGEYKSMHFSAKDSNGINEMRLYMNDTMCFEIYTGCSKDETDSVKAEISEIIDGFNPEFDSASTYDLSNVENDCRTFKDDKYKISMRLPARWYEEKNEAENSFCFVNGDRNENDSILLGIYSKSDSVTAEQLCTKDRSMNEAYVNDVMSTVSEITKEQLFGQTCFKYCVASTSANKKKTMVTDIFFEIGEYVYNISSVEQGDDSGALRCVYDSLEARILDNEQIGVILRNDYDETEILNARTDKWTLKIPATWSFQVQPEDQEAYFTNKITSAMISVGAYDFNGDLFKEMKKELDEYKKDATVSVVTPVEERSVDGKKYCFFCVRSTDDDGNDTYIQCYAMTEKKKLCKFCYFDSAECINARGEDDFVNLIKSFTLK